MAGPVPLALRGPRHAPRLHQARKPNLNGKAERSHLTDQLEFYQLLDYTGDVDLRAKLAVWEEFYNLQRPHAAHAGRTPYEVLREKLVS